jgi:glycine cleavage system H protein
MKFEFPEDLYYTKEHEWVRVDDGVATIGVTDYAQDSLGDVVFVELPEEGAELQKDESFGVVESVKAVSDLFSPVTGEVIEINDALPDSPEVVNSDPYGEAWMLKLNMNDETELRELMSAKDYRAYLASQEEKSADDDDEDDDDDDDMDDENDTEEELS